MTTWNARSLKVEEQRRLLSLDRDQLAKDRDAAQAQFDSIARSHPQHSRDYREAARQLAVVERDLDKLAAVEERRQQLETRGVEDVVRAIPRG